MLAKKPMKTTIMRIHKITNEIFIRVNQSQKKRSEHYLQKFFQEKKTKQILLTI